MVDEAATPVGEAAEAAFVLHEDVPYVRNWANAEGAAGRLRAELAACGLVGRTPGVRADVTVAGVGVVELGRVTPATAELLADLPAIARQASVSAVGVKRTALSSGRSPERTGRRH